MAQPTGEYPRPISRPNWLSARARNAVNRPTFIGAVGLGAFTVALVALLLAPQQIRRVVGPRSLPVEARQDTTPLVAALAQASARLSAAESSLALARRNPAPAVRPDTLTPPANPRRDTLANAVNDLDGLITRVESAPVAASYRALAESPQLSSNGSVRALVDSLDDIEKEREAFGAAGGADPMYIALTARTTEIGKAIHAIAQSRRDELRQQIARVSTPPPQQAVVQSPASDTAAWIATRDSAQSLSTQAFAALTQAREKLKAQDLKATEASRERVDVPPIALLGAALVFGVALGFGSAFVSEMRKPRISSDHEVERITGLRVLATVKPHPRHPDRRRRSSDNDVAPYFDPAADGYQLTYLTVARAGASRLVLTIAAEETAIAAVVASNVAAIAADEARSTLLIDTDSMSSPVSAILRIHAEPGIADIVERGVDWSEVSTQAQVGRDRAIDVVAAGLASKPRTSASLTAFLRSESARMARHYEAIIVATSQEDAMAGVPSSLPIPDTILCARLGHTAIASLQTAAAAIRGSGGNPLGIVLWDAPPPSLPSSERLSSARRPLRTAEMQALTSR